MNLVPLYEEAIQFNNFNGTVLAAGKVEVWYLGRTRKADIYADVAGETPLPNPFDLNDLGMQEVYVNPAFNYTLVVYDPYGSELFSVDKYLQGAGDHTTSNVVVQPSEHIGVSAWTVGEVQIYQPYLVGEVGKVYEGIDPIVVNNDVNRISANHIPLGVQDPLYFVEDSETACILGCSAQTEIPVELSGKWDNASDAVIANSAQWSEGTTYEAGSYIDINNNTISVTGLSTLPADTASTGLVAQVSADITAMIPDTSDMATQTWVNEQGFLTAHQDISNKLDTTAFSTVSGDFLTAIPSEYVTENTLQSGLSSKLDSTAFSTVSGNFLTAHQSLDGLMSSTLLEISDNKITGYNGTAFAGQGGGVTGDYELSAGSGISIVDYPLEQKTVISVTAQGGNPEVEQAVIDNSATWNSVTSKADVTAIPSTAGLATENWVTAQGYITGVDLSNYATTGDLQTVSGEITAMIPTALTGDYVEGNNESGFTIASTAGSIDVGENEYLGSQAIGIIKSNSGIWLSPNQLEIYGNGVDETINANDISRLKQLSSNKLDVSAIGTAEYDGEFVSVHTINNLPIWSNYSNWADAADRANEAKWDSTNRAISALPNSATVNSMIISSITGKADTSALTAYAKNWQLGELEDIVDTKLDSTAFSTVSGTFLTAHQDLSDYQTTAGMTAYLTTADSAEFYTTANESGFITGVPAGTMNESAFGYDTSNNITAYNGSAFKAGDEFPQSATDAINVVTGGSANWNGTTETVSSNSGAWGGSALPISAGPGIKFEIVDNTLVASTDETVLWSGTTGTATHTTAFTLTEPLTNFERIRFEGYQYGQSTPVYEITIPNDSTYVGVFFQYFCFNDDGNPYQIRGGSYSSNNGLDYTVFKEKFLYWSNTSLAAVGGNTNQGPNINKIVGINRIAGGN